MLKSSTNQRVELHLSSQTQQQRRELQTDGIQNQMEEGAYVTMRPRLRTRHDQGEWTRGASFNSAVSSHTVFFVAFRLHCAAPSAARVTAPRPNTRLRNEPASSTRV